MHSKRRNNINPLRGLGILLLSLGIMLLAAKTDILGWGSTENYFRWEMLLIFISLMMFFHGNFTGAVFASAAGLWFLIPDLIPPPTAATVRTAFWPAVLILAGITLFIPHRTKR